MVDDTDGSVANGNHIQVWDSRSAGDANQTWKVVSKGSHDVIELAKAPTHCLDVTGHGIANGTKIQLWSCISGDVDQKWKPLPGGQLEAVYASAKRGEAIVLDDPNAGGEGTRLQIWASNGRKQQFWRLP